MHISCNTSWKFQRLRMPCLPWRPQRISIRLDWDMGKRPNERLYKVKRSVRNISKRFAFVKKIAKIVGKWKLGKSPIAIFFHRAKVIFYEIYKNKVMITENFCRIEAFISCVWSARKCQRQCNNVFLGGYFVKKSLQQCQSNAAKQNTENNEVGLIKIKK